MRWSHRASGIAVVASNASNFLADVQSSQVFTSAAEDLVLQWQDPNLLAQEVTPGDEGLFSFQWNMQAIEAPAAWAAGCTGNGVRVAIIDGGIDPTHPDLAPNMDAACSVSFVPDQAFDTDTGTLWHGMHVAGIVAAADNGVGVIGVAPEATLIGVKALHDGTGSFGGVIGAILYAADPAAFGRPECGSADIINMSLGATFPKRGGAGPLIGAMAQAVNFAASKGVLVVSAAGNEGMDLGQSKDFTSIPAEAGAGLAISATGPLDIAGVLGLDANPRNPASYSNYGEGTVWVAAPGGEPGITAQIVVNSPASLAGAKLAQVAAYGPSPAGETGDVVLWTDPVDTTGDPHDACEGGADPAVAGKIALIHRGSCAFVDKSTAADLSGATGVIISNNQPGIPPILGGDAAVTVPSVSGTQSDGAAMEAEPAGTVNVSLFPNPSGALDQVASTCISGWCLAFGTSMAAPAASGVAALIKANNPRMSVGELKARLAQTADDEGPRGHDEFYGHGFVNAANACMSRLEIKRLCCIAADRGSAAYNRLFNAVFRSGV